MSEAPREWGRCQGFRWQQGQGDKGGEQGLSVKRLQWMLGIEAQLNLEALAMRAAKYCTVLSCCVWTGMVLTSSIADNLIISGRNVWGRAWHVERARLEMRRGGGGDI